MVGSVSNTAVDTLAEGSSHLIVSSQSNTDVSDVMITSSRRDICVRLGVGGDSGATAGILSEAMKEPDEAKKESRQCLLESTLLM